MPEGDTLYRTAVALRVHLVGKRVTAATARTPGPRAELLVGTTIIAVESIGKNLILRFDSGLELRTHLRMRGAWHRYRPGERWRRPAARARILLEVSGSVAVCFDAPVVELLESRAEAFHPPLARLGPDLLSDDFDEREALARLRAGARANVPIAQALLDQAALAGIGNVYCDEALFAERVDPFVLVGDLPDEALERLVRRARTLLRANRLTPIRTTTPAAVAAAGSRLWVYGRAGRPCPRCGAILLARRLGDPPRRRTWCPRCQSAAIAG